MATVKLVFSQAPVATPGTVRLVFGDDGGTPAIPDATLHGSGRITGLRLHITAGVATPLVGTGRITGLRLHLATHYDTNVSRPTVGQAAGRWQDAEPLQHAAYARWQQSARLPTGTCSRWQDAAPMAASLQTRWQDTQQRQRAVHGAFEQARRLPAAPLRASYQEAQRLRTSASDHMQQAQRLPADPLRVRYQETYRDRQLRAVACFEQAAHLARPIASAMGIALRLPAAIGGRYQQAWPPRPGQWQRPAPPLPEPCYLPTLPAHLVFDTPWTGDGRLVFVCERHGPGPGPDPEQPHYVIPLLEVYVSVHTLNAVLLPSLEPVALLGATLESDDGGFGWSLSADGPEHLLDQLAPASGLPARVRLTIDGIDWVFAVERVGRTRRFGQHRASIQGRSVTALLGDPYMPQQSWLSSSDLTAQQLVAQALQYTGTTVDWGINDWLVPAGAWSFTGTPLQAALRVAESAGAVLRSHRTNAELIFAPRYPALPWAWGAATPNVQMPADIIATDSLEPEPRPAYNAVYVSGMAQGVLGHVRRSGTAGDLLAPQVTDALITHEVAARQRGSAVLGAAGPKLTQTMTLPLLTGGSNPGLIQPGYLIQVDDIGHTWRGLVRGIRVTAGMPTVRQTITVERNA